MSTMPIRGADGNNYTIAVPNPNGQAPSASSSPVVIASDQSPIPVSLVAPRTDTLWTDDTGSFFVRVDQGGTITWTTITGGASSAPSTGARPAAGPSVLLSRSSYAATASGTGYAINDFLDHFVTTDPQSGAILGNFWIDITAGATVATPPSSGNISPISALPTGAATAANQSTAISSLATLITNTGRIPSLGQAASSASVPVVLASTQVGTAGTPSTTVLTVQGSGSGTALPVSLASLPALTTGSAIVGRFGIDQTTPGTTNGVQIVSGIPTGNNTIGSIKVLDGTGNGLTSTSGALDVNLKTSGITVSVSGTFWQATQPVSAASLPLPTGAATSANQSTEITSLASIVTNTTGIATSSLQTTGNSSLASIVTNTNKIPSLGQAANAGSVPVTLSSTQVGTAGTPSTTVLSVQGVASGTALAVTGTFWQATQPVSGTLAVSSVSGSVAVTGTFWQATQPVSGTVGVSGSVAVTGTFWQATQPVSFTMPALVSGSATIGAVKVTDGTNTVTVKAASTAAVAADTAQVVALSPNNNTLANALLTKMTDGTNTAAVKAASTAPVATDPALVIAISGNSAAHPVTPQVGGSNISSANPMPVSTPLAGLVVTQKAIAVANTAIAFSANALVNGVIITASPSNTGPIWIGGSGVLETDDGTGNGYKLVPGQSSPGLGVLNTNAVYIIGANVGDFATAIGN